MTETKKTYCRFCLGCCGIEVDVNDGRLVSLKGDTSNPLTGGYTCLRGRELITMHTHKDRIRGALKREGNEFASIPLHQALDEIATKIGQLLAESGGRAIASYNGSWAWSNMPTLPVSKAFHRAIDSPSMFSPMTLDQPAKALMPMRFGIWSGGIHSFKDADVVMFIGNNTVLSQYSPAGGLPPYNASRRLQDALNTGLTLIVIDPRKTEVARKATLHLQPRPGEDPTLLAGITRIIIDNQWHDVEFCDEFVESLAEFRQLLEPFTLEYAAKRADVPKDDIIEAARLFASGSKGAASTGTGPEMSPQGSLTEHMVMTLNTICGRYYREGEVPPSAPPLTPPRPRKAQVMFPPKPWGDHLVQSRFRGLGQLGDEMPCNILADEILTSGEGQIRALFVNGGNPVVAFPNQQKITRAMESLDLLVAIDPWMSATAKRADYILGPVLQLERDDATMLGEMYFEEPYAHYTEKLVEPGAELIEEWELYWELAIRLGIELEVNKVTITNGEKPSKYQITELLTQGSAIPLSRVRQETANAGGKIYPEAQVAVAAKSQRNRHRFQLLPDDVEQQLQNVARVVLDDLGRPRAISSHFEFLLTSRRIKQFFNSTGHNFENLREKGSTNWAYMHSSDLAKLKIPSESLVEIVAETGRIVGAVKASDDIKPGVISMAHGFGDANSDCDNVRSQGVSTNALVSDEKYFDPITGQARQSAIPVNIRML
ncbi:MAG: molybdopterin-dependent oxidoreductase [Pseudomonadales bacterium]